MNQSLITADGSTHLKVLAVSLLAAMLVIWIGMCARSIPAASPAAAPRIERSDAGTGALTRERTASMPVMAWSNPAQRSFLRTPGSGTMAEVF